MNTVQTTDYSASFLMFRIDTLKQNPITVTHKLPTSVNNARMQLDSRCWIVETASGKRVDYVLAASCKTEKVGVPAGIWTMPNADYMPIASKEYFLAIKTFDRADKRPPLEPPLTGIQSERQVFKISEAFDKVEAHLRCSQGVVLEDVDAIIAATFANEKMVARTTLRNDRYEAVIEYPVKLMNVNEREKIYQTDTGPVILPNLDAPEPMAIDTLEVAYSAFNCPDWIEFIVRDRSRIVDDVDVYHYCRPFRVDARNEVIRLIA